MNWLFLFAACAVLICGGCAAEPVVPEVVPQSTSDATLQSEPAQPPASTPTDIASPQDLEEAKEALLDGQQYVAFPAVGVRVVRPNGFDDAENFHGFQRVEKQSSIMAVMIPGPFSQVADGFTESQLGASGLELQSKETIQIDGISGVLLGIKQNASGIEFSKWLIAFGDDSGTRMVTATFPSNATSDLSAQLKAVVLSTRIDDTPAPTPSAEVRFAIDQPRNLKLTRGIGKMLMYTKNGNIRQESPNDPIFIAAPSLSEVSANDKRQFALLRLHQTAHTTIVNVTSNHEVSIDGLDGYELIAEAQDEDSGNPMKVYQVLLFDDGAYILMQGLVGASDADEYLQSFKAMAHSLTRRLD